MAERRVAEVVSERERLIKALGDLPFVRRIWPSAANFFLLEVDDADALMRQTSTDNVLLRYFGGSLANCVRITIGTRDENNSLLQSLAKVGF